MTKPHKLVTGKAPVERFAATPEPDAQDAQAKAIKRGKDALASGEARKFRPIAPKEFDDPRKPMSAD